MQLKLVKSITYLYV